MASDSDIHAGRRKWVALFAGCALLAAATGCRKHPPRVAVPPQVVSPGEEVGLASWYGHPYHGRRTASGEIYDMNRYTAAHRTRPFNTWVRVHNLENGKWVDVRINDRGPFVDGRIIDLSRAAARAIGIIGPGTAWVRLETIPGPGSLPAPAAEGSKATVRFGVQVGAFRNRANAERLARKMRRRYGDVRIERRGGDPPVWRVVVGGWSTEEEARSRAAGMKGVGGAPFVVRLDTDSEPGT